MIAIPSRHKSLTLLAGVVVVQVLLLAAQIKREQQVRLIRVWAVELVSPLQRVAAWSINGAAHGWGGYVGLRTAQKENDSMRAELERLKIRNAELEGRALEADRLAALLNFRNSHVETPMIAAHVIGGSPDSGSQMVNIDRGSRDGIRRDMGVITPDGVVGKVIEAYPNTSQVLLLTDKDSGVGAMLSDSRIQSPVGGTGEPLLYMKYVPNDDTVNNGERVVTSGMDRIFPRDLPVGTIVDIKAGNPFKQIRLRPAANLERLEEVIVLLTLHPLELRTESETPIPQTPVASKTDKAPAAKP
jgi:rod shape-determining protein MreC